VAAITFWLAVLKTRGLSPPSSSMMWRLTSRARRLAAPPSQQVVWSCTRVSRSCRRHTRSSSSLASSSLSYSRLGRQTSAGANAGPCTLGWLPRVAFGGGDAFLYSEGPVPPWALGDAPPTSRLKHSHDGS